MINVEQLRKTKKKSILFIGSYPTIIQSQLDYDFLLGEKPSIVGIIAYGRQTERYFFGKKEILIPVFPSLEKVPAKLKETITAFFNNSSGRRVLSSTLSCLELLPNLLLGVIFAEETPEKHSLFLQEKVREKNVTIFGPSSVGFLLPSSFKLGPIGGVDYRQIERAKILEKGNVAVFSSSGGMTNELISLVTSSGHGISFAMSFGGDRFPITSPLEAFLAAEKDSQTKTIVYFGELGGYDEYEIAKAIQMGKIKKRVLCYIAGTIAEMFETPPQFGHAKALAEKGQETALAKRNALNKAGAKAAMSFTEFVRFIKDIPINFKSSHKYDMLTKDMDDRNHALIATTLSADTNGKVEILGEDLLIFAKQHSFAEIVTALFLGQKKVSKDTVACIDFILRLLVDHGPYVSGAVNTIITARAGRDLVSSLSTGLLTIGPRFGGAINEAAGNWLVGVSQHITPSDFVEKFANQKKRIAGIGHKKYRSDFPDPRVQEVLRFAPGKKAYAGFSKEVEKITTAKKANLILNVDGAIAAVLLDIFAEKENYSNDQLQKLVDTEFFNAIFVLSRSVGFIGHYLDQKRLDEGLFRLREEDVATITPQE